LDSSSVSSICNISSQSIYGGSQIPVDKEKNATFTLIISQELHANLKEMALAMSEVSISKTPVMQPRQLLAL
jgi:hypothetical protein